MWDESNWNSAVDRWNNARSRWPSAYAEVSSTHPTQKWPEDHPHSDRFFTSKQVGDLFQQMLDELESLGIADPQVTTFCDNWSNYLCERLNYNDCNA